MSASVSSSQNPTTAAATQNATAATASLAASSSNVAAGSAQPTARSYANATKKTSSPPIASSAAPPVAVGGPPNAQHGKGSSISPVNGKNPIQPAVPTMAPTIVNSSNVNGAPAHSDHSRKSSVTISAAGTSGYIPNGGPVSGSRAPSNLTFGAISGSPAPAHSVPHHPQGAGLNLQGHNPRVASPAHSPSPIPTPATMSGGKPQTNMPGREMPVFGGGNDAAESNARPLSMPPQANPLPQAQHLRRESSQSAHSDMSNPNMNRGFPNGRGRGFTPGYNPQMGHNSPQPYRSLPNAPRGNPNMPPFQPSGPMGGNSPFRASRSPAITPAVMHQQAHYANNPGMPPYGYPPQPGYPQQVRIPSHPVPPLHLPSSLEARTASTSVDSPRSSPSFSKSGATSTTIERLVEAGIPDEQRATSFRPCPPNFSFNATYDQYLTTLQKQGMYGMPQQQLDPYGTYYANQYGMGSPMHYPGAVPASPGRGHSFPQQMQGHYTLPGAYSQHPQGQPMSRSPSQVSERPPSAVAQPSTPAMTNVSHVSHTHTPSATSNSPAPSSSTFIPAKKTSKAIVIKKPDGEVVSFDKKAASPAPPAQPPRSPAIVSTPTPPPRAPSAAGSTHSRTESTIAKSDKERRAEFLEQFQQNLKAEKEKEEAEKKAQDEQESKAKAEADAKALKEKEEAEAKAAKEEEEARKAAKEKEEAEAAEKAKREEEEKKRLEQEEEDRMIAEMEALEREEEERERQFAEKRKREREEAKAKEAEKAKLEDERLRQQERDAEAAEEARANESAEQKAERESLFASLKKNTQFGPGANAPASDSGASTPTAESTPSVQPKGPSATKPKPVPLKLETNKPVEPAQPTAGMQSLKSARFLQVRNELVNYPDGIKSPNPALNQNSKGRGRQYDKEFLLQFQEVFKEKPSVDWDMKLKETVGDSSDSARPQSARPPSMGMGSRPPSRTSLPAGGPMGNFGQFGGRTLPPGTTSEQRFREANSGRPTMTNPLAQFANRPGGFPMGPPPMARTGSFQNMAQAGPNSPRVGSSRGRNSRRGDKGPSRKEEEAAAKAMPLTAGMDLKPLERSTTGWKPHSQAAAAPQLAAGHLAPDVVQRKVKAALNKMTPEKFDKIADQILDIAAQSKDETDGRTLRQVIQLTFEKACDEAHWASMYARFCHRMLTTMSPEIQDENVKDKNGQPVVGGALFRKYLLNRCQEEFERGWEVNLPDKPEGQTDEAAMLSDEYYIAAAAKRKGLGLIQFIGELYKLGMLTLRIMHECVLKLLDFEGMPDESAIESLVKLLRTVGATMEATEAGPKMIAMYFERIEKTMNLEGLPSRLRFMLLDTVDLRRAGWKSKDDTKGPKTIAEIHQEAAAAQQAAEMERTRSNQRGGPRPQMGRGDARSFSGAGGIVPPQDFPSGRVQMDDLRKLSKGASGRNLNAPGQLGPSTLGQRSNSGRRGLGPALMGRGDESGASSRTATPPVQKEKESTTHMNSFSALAALENEGAGEVGSPPSTASSPPVSKSIPVRTKSPAVEAKDGAKPSE